MAKLSGMNRFPDEVLRFDRGLLRAPGEQDLADLTSACNDEAIRAWLPLPVPYTEQDARNFVFEHAVSQLASGQGTERALESQGRLCGMFGFHATNWSVGSTEAGYWLAPWGRGRGLMTTALVVMTQWAFEQGMQRVAVRVATRNLASLAVALRAGFVIEGTMRQAGRASGVLVDHLLLSRLSTDPTPW